MTITESNHKKMDEVTPLLSRERQQDRWENDAKRVNNKKPSTWFVIIPLFFLTLCFGALYAPMIQFYTVVFCYRHYQSQTGESTDIPIESCTIPEVQAIISQAQAVIMFLSYGSTLLVASYYGSLSDRKGRRLIFKLAGVGNCLLMIAYIATIKYQNIFGVSLLFIAPVMRGLMAGDTLLFAAVQAYISDCTTPAERTVAFGRFLGAMYLGTTVGPVAASVLIKKTGSIMSIFYMVLIISSIFELYAIFILPESHDFRRFKPTTPKKQDTLLERINVFSALRILFRASSRHANSYALVIIAAVSFLLAVIALPPTILYAMLTFKWTAYEGGIYISLGSFSRLVVLTVLLPFASKIFHKKNPEPIVEEPEMMTQPKIIEEEFPEDESSTTSSSNSSKDIPELSDKEVRHAIKFDTWMIRFGLAVETITLIVMGLATTSLSFTLTGMVQSLASLAQPSLRSLTTALVSPNEIGELLGAMAVLEACAMILSQITINTIYSASVRTMPELIFFICAGFSVVATGLAFFVKPLPLTEVEEQHETA